METETVQTGIPWVEKYRPKRLSEIAGHRAIVATLRDYIANGDPEHMLFCGPYGVGKTAAAHAFANDYLGAYRDGNVLELNASEERTLETVRDRIMDFARALPFAPHGARVKRIIIMDEAEGLPKATLEALRRPMELYAHNVLFIFTTNAPLSDLALMSRCVTFDFQRVDVDSMARRMAYILKEEGVEATLDDLRRLAQSCDGDMRKAIQTARRFAVAAREGVA